MTPKSGVIICIAYILGLLSTSVAWGGYGVLVLGIAAAILSSFGRTSKLYNRFGQIKPQLWLIAGLIGFLATVYFQLRIPQPAANDISRFVASADVTPGRQVVTVQGEVASTPRLTRNQRSQFWLEASKLDVRNNLANADKEVTGKLYVTVPLLQATGLHQGQAIAVIGILYKPKPSNNPGTFDFRAYLAQEGGFAGLKGRKVSLLNEEYSRWGWWAVRQRIIRSQVQWLGVPEGPLVSALVLGNRVVDLPFNISDLFIKIGLAHALAASGFQVSLILGIVLALARRFSSRIQFGSGVLALITFVCLSGPQPSVLRAFVMGIGALAALVLQRQVKPLGLLLLAATLLLLFNPVWIWNLSFDFSFLSTLGLVITVPALVKRLDWLPPTVATLIAVPIAAFVWTIPLQLFKFGLVSPYSILVNIVTTIPLSIISIGAFISAIAALFLPIAGSAIAWLLYYPTHALIATVEFFSNLPGATVAVGTISSVQCVALYSLIGLVCLQKWWQQRWWVAGLMAISLVFIPIWQVQATTRVTVLATGTEPVLVIQDRGRVLLVNSGKANNARYTVLPFLQQQGVNQIDWAIALNSPSSDNSAWLEILQRLPIKNLYAFSDREAALATIQKQVGRSHVNYQYLNFGQMVATDSTSIKVLNNQIPALQLQIKDQNWLILGSQPKEQLTIAKKLPQAQVLLWSGNLDPDIIQAVKPEVAIASATTLNHNTMSTLLQAKAKVFLTGQDGAIEWTPKGKFKATTETVEDKAALLSS